MGRVQDLYDARVRQLVPTERLQLARLILDDLARIPADDIDVSDEWGDDDLADLGRYGAAA